MSGQQRLSVSATWLITLCCCGLGGCGSADSPAGGAPLYEQVRAAREEENPARRARSLIRLALLQQRSKDASGAQQTIGFASAACDQVSDPADRAGLLTLLARAQASVGRSGAGDTLRRLERSIAEIEDLETRLTVQAAGALAHAAAGSRSDAVDRLAAVEDDAAELDDPAARVRVLCRTAETYDDSLVADAQAADGLIDAAMSLAQEIPDDRAMSRALVDVAKTQSRLRRPAADATFELALQSARKIDSPWSRAHALHDVAAATPDRATSARILTEAEAVCAQIPEPDLRKQTLQMIRETMDRANLNGR